MAFNRYAGLSWMLEKNLFYLAGLVALEQWYRCVRRDFFHGEELGYLVYNGALDNLRLARGERFKRLKVMAEKMPESVHHDESDIIKNRKLEFYQNVDEVCSAFEDDQNVKSIHKHRDSFLEALEAQKKDQDFDYIASIQGLPEAVSAKGTKWLQAIVDDRCQKAAGLLPAMELFGRSG